MKSIIVSMVAAAGLIVAGSTLAAEIPAEGGACKACHDIDKKKIGPALKDVAAKYKDDKDAVAKIEASIMKGGKFGWGTPISMPVKGGAKSDADVKKMAEFVAGLK